MITLAPMTVADAHELAARDEGIARDADEAVPWPPSTERVAGWVAAAERARAAGTSHLFAVHARGVAVGATRLGVISSNRGVAQLSYWILRDERGRGYATAAALQTLATAFGPLALARIQTIVDEHNTPSRAVLVRTGFVLKGQLVDGRLCYEHQKERVHG